MAGYVIGSAKGQAIADSMSAGQSYKCSDGSTWTKNNDGSVSVVTKNGGYTANAYQSKGSTSAPTPKASSADYLVRNLVDQSSANTTFNQNSANRAMEFSAQEAEKNRVFQTTMSNTAHQREVADLVKAGLNPVLSANSGASVPTGATASGVQASADTSAVSAIAGLLGQFLQINSAQTIANKQMDNALEIARLQADIQKYATDKGYDASIFSANSSRSASKYASDISKIIAGISANASMFGATTSANASMANTADTNKTSRYIQHMQQEFEDYLHKTYPNNPFNLFGQGKDAVKAVKDWYLNDNSSLSKPHKTKKPY